MCVENKTPGGTRSVGWHLLLLLVLPLNNNGTSITGNGWTLACQGKPAFVIL